MNFIFKLVGSNKSRVLSYRELVLNIKYQSDCHQLIGYVISHFETLQMTEVNEKINDICG